MDSFLEKTSGVLLACFLILFRFEASVCKFVERSVHVLDLERILKHHSRHKKHSDEGSSEIRSKKEDSRSSKIADHLGQRNRKEFSLKVKCASGRNQA